MSDSTDTTATSDPANQPAAANDQNTAVSAQPPPTSDQTTDVSAQPPPTSNTAPPTTPATTGDTRDASKGEQQAANATKLGTAETKTINDIKPLRDALLHPAKSGGDAVPIAKAALTVTTDIGKVYDAQKKQVSRGRFS